MHGKKGCGSWSNTDLFNICITRSDCITCRVRRLPQFHSHWSLLVIHMLWHTDCDNSKDGHRALKILWFSLSSQPPTQMSQPFHKNIPLFCICVNGERKSWVSQMCRAQTTIKQVTDHRNSAGIFTVKDSTNVVPSGGNQTDRVMPPLELAHKKQVTPRGIQGFCIQSHLSWMPWRIGRSGCTRTAQLLGATLPESWIKHPWPAIPELSRAELEKSHQLLLKPMLHEKLRKYQVIYFY